MKKLVGMISIGGLAAGVLTLALGVDSVQADGGVKVGTLKCNEASGWGLVIGSSRDLKCVFTNTKGEEHRYEGKIRKFGADIGYKKSAIIVWGVFAPAADVAPGALEGVYAGATVDASVAVGLGANVLVGGGESSIALQPLSVEGVKGLNAAAGLAGISLKHVK